MGNQEVGNSTKWLDVHDVTSYDLGMHTTKTVCNLSSKVNPLDIINVI